MDITWTRGDTKPLKITIKSKASAGATALPMDLSGYASLTLCINEEQEPTDVALEKVKQVGTIQDQVASKGKVEFPMDGNEDFLGEFFYDIQGILTTGSLKDTLIKGSKFTYEQDINKD